MSSTASIAVDLAWAETWGGKVVDAVAVAVAVAVEEAISASLAAMFGAKGENYRLSLLFFFSSFPQHTRRTVWYSYKVASRRYTKSAMGGGRCW